MDRKNILLKYEVKEFSNHKYIVFVIFDDFYNTCELGSLIYAEDVESFLRNNINEDIKPYITWKPARNNKTGEKYIKLTLDL